ncbi:MAG: hypothetical protein GY862_25040 [Gammaproteobacteria bacterium]|nr:hypothetical protein [Gammaproteobacteria bacterium]
MTFGADSSTLVSGGKDGSAIVWDIDVQSWEEQACRIPGRNFTRKEWRSLTDKPYQRTCPQYIDNFSLLDFGQN